MPAHDELISHLERTTSLSRGEATRVVADVLAYFSEPVQVLVRRRHTELRARGLPNDQIFAQLAAELERRCAYPPRRLRKLRRLPSPGSRRPASRPASCAGSSTAEPTTDRSV